MTVRLAGGAGHERGTEMKVLVVFASRHGATAGIAAAIGDALRESGLEVTVMPVEDVAGVSRFDAVVLGSAVYMGHWLKPARLFAMREARSLSERPVWLFSSGPVGDPLTPAEHAVDVSDTLRLTGAREHHLFAGELDRERLGVLEKTIVSALRVPAGDFRDWAEVRAWSAGIGAALLEEAVHAGRVG